MENLRGKEQSYYEQAKAEFQNNQYEKAIKLLTSAIEIKDSKIEFYLLRSKCYNALSQVTQAVVDANKVIELEQDITKLKPSLHFCNGFESRAEALFFAGSFEDALVDYFTCTRKRPGQNHDIGVQNCFANIKACFNYEDAVLDKAVRALEQGVLKENEVVTASDGCSIYQYKPPRNPLEASSVNSSVMSALPSQQTQRKQEDILTVESIRKKELMVSSTATMLDISQIAKAAPAQLKHLNEDLAFLEYISDMSELKQSASKAIQYVNEREHYWEGQRAGQQAKKQNLSPKQEVQKPDPKMSLSPKTPVKPKTKDDLRTRLLLERNRQKIEELEKRLQKPIIPYTEFRQKSQKKERARPPEEAQQIITQTSNIRRVARGGKLQLALEFSEELVKACGDRHDSYYDTAVCLKAQALAACEQLKKAVDCCGENPACQRIKAQLLLQAGQPDLAINVCERLAASLTGAQKADVLTTKARALVKAHKFQEALSVLRAAEAENQELLRPAALYDYELSQETTNRDVFLAGLDVQMVCFQVMGLVDQADACRERAAARRAGWGMK